MTINVDMRTAIRMAMNEEMEHDENVLLMGEEVGGYNGAYKVSKGMLAQWGDKRVIDTPICESAFTGLAIGAAMAGLRPIVEFMSFNFSFLAIDQIFSNAATMYYMSAGRFSVPIVFRGPNGAAAQVSCQHSHCVAALYALYPGLIVIAPSNPYDARGLLKSAIRNNNPVLMLECELLYNLKQDIPEKPYLIELGEASIVREGTHITIITFSKMVHVALEASETLKKDGVDIEIIDLRTIKPLDIKTIKQSINKTNRCLCIEEGHVFGGVSAEIIAQINEHAFDSLDAPVERLCQMDVPLPYSKALEEKTIPHADLVCERVRRMLQVTV
ncbi:alpha-ketoacid dehydrogenase subunit beta [Chlamydiia bacterium]|nr:alpha-ketoacid dehydrogenase subunit beta [Chlamydiia bacterium]